MSSGISALLFLVVQVAMLVVALTSVPVLISTAPSAGRTVGADGPTVIQIANELGPAGLYQDLGAMVEIDTGSGGIDLDFLLSITDRFGTIDKDRAVDAGYQVQDGDAWLAQDVQKRLLVDTVQSQALCEVTIGVEWRLRPPA